MSFSRSHCYTIYVLLIYVTLAMMSGCLFLVSRTFLLVFLVWYWPNFDVIIPDHHSTFSRQVIFHHDDGNLTERAGGAPGSCVYQCRDEWRPFTVYQRRFVSHATVLYRRSSSFHCYWLRALNQIPDRRHRRLGSAWSTYVLQWRRRHLYVSSLLICVSRYSC